MSESLVIEETSESFLLPLNFDVASQAGYRRLRRAAISSSSDESLWDEVIDIPVHLESVQSLAFIGFKKAAAEEIFKRYQSALTELSNMPVNIYDFMTGFINGDGSENAYMPDHDWNSVLKNSGIKKKVRQGILNPDFDHIRMSKSAKEWAVETVEDGWIFLTGINEAVRKNQEKIKKAFLAEGPGARAKRRSELGSEAEQQTQQSAHPTTADHFPLPADDQHVVLYKGGSVPRLEQALASDGKLTLNAILSVAPSDFSSTRPFLYFSKQYQCAFEYAGYAFSRSPNQDAGIMTISVTKNLVLDSRELFDEEWRQLVFACRGPYRFTKDGLEIQQEYEQEALLIGPICGISNEQCNRLSDASEITSMTLKTGVKASQHVITSGKRVIDIGEACAGRARVEITMNKGTEHEKNGEKRTV